ncbi:MAG: hypothetical protein ACI9WU_003634 [Myxococcota bacterium]
MSRLNSTSSSWGVVLERVTRYFGIMSQASGYRLAAEDDRVWLICRQVTGAPPMDHHASEFSLAAPCSYGKRFVQGAFAIQAVEFPDPEPPHASLVRDWFDAPVRYMAGRRAVAFSRHVLELPMADADASLSRILERYAERELSDLPELDDPLERARSVAATLLPDGRADLETVARTITIRRELAEHHLAMGDASIAEIAWSLDFSEPAAFHRAFKRWTGQSPRRYRASSGG